MKKKKSHCLFVSLSIEWFRFNLVPVFCLCILFSVICRLCDALLQRRTQLTLFVAFACFVGRRQKQNRKTKIRARKTKRSMQNELRWLRNVYEYVCVLVCPTPNHRKTYKVKRKLCGDATNDKMSTFALIRRMKNMRLKHLMWHKIDKRRR